MTRRVPVDLLGSLLADVAALDGAHCTGSGAEVVDVDQADAERVVRYYGHRCTVVGRWREVGDALAPHSSASIYGGRVYARGEPADGWPGGCAG